ncbi:MAG: lysylphosphatidylglycerol synthase transmembrane domain-containing protein, partial [Halobacteria archaeon]|nr:lysylphosphatidylglycerol synthase transmembrane domain-containing protein [Halobacteria archaeon]
MLVGTLWSRVKNPLRRPWVRFALLLVVVVTAFGFFLDSFDFETVTQRLLTANLAFVGSGVFVYTASWLPRGYRYRELLRATGYRCKTSVLTGAVFVSQTSNLVFPARAGDGTRAYIVKKRNGVPYTAGFASLAAERVLDLVAVAVVGTVGFVITVYTFGVGFGSLDLARGRYAVIGAIGVGLTTLLGTGVYFYLRSRLPRSSLLNRDENEKPD